MDEMGCPSREQISAYLVGALGDSEFDRIEEHLAACANCAELADQLEPPKDPLLDLIGLVREAERRADEQENLSLEDFVKKKLAELIPRQQLPPQSAGTGQVRTRRRRIVLGLAILAAAASLLMLLRVKSGQPLGIDGGAANENALARADLNPPEPDRGLAPRIVDIKVHGYLNPPEPDRGLPPRETGLRSEGVLRRTLPAASALASSERSPRQTERRYGEIARMTERRWEGRGQLVVERQRNAPEVSTKEPRTMPAPEVGPIEIGPPPVLKANADDPKPGLISEDGPTSYLARADLGKRQPQLFSLAQQPASRGGPGAAKSALVVQIREGAGLALAHRIIEPLRELRQSVPRPAEIAVLAFGDQRGIVGEDLFFAAKTLQGELTAELRNLSGEDLLVWDPSRLKKRVEETGADVKQLSAQDYSAAAAELKKIGLDAAVVGSFQVDGNDRATGITNAHCDILLADRPPLQAVANATTYGAPEPWLSAGISTRFSVDVLFDGKPLPMYVEFSHSSGQARRICLDLDRETHCGRPFTLRLQNHGMPPAGWLARTESEERSRFFCAAVFVDGVNSIYEKGPNGEFHPSQRHPDNVTRWVLTAPGVSVLPGYDSTGNTSAQKRVQGLGGSVVDIQGFQIDDKTAALFQFADAGELQAAHDVGLTKDIGLISVYIYSEQSPGDIEWNPPGTELMTSIGARIGRSVPNDIFGVRVRTHEQPVEIWNIYYRYRGEKGSVASLRAEGQNIIPIEVAKADMKRRFREEEREFGGVFRARREQERKLRDDGSGQPIE